MNDQSTTALKFVLLEGSPSFHLRDGHAPFVDGSLLCPQAPIYAQGCIDHVLQGESRPQGVLDESPRAAGCPASNIDASSPVSFLIALQIVRNRTGVAMQVGGHSRHVICRKQAIKISIPLQAAVTDAPAASEKKLWGGRFTGKTDPLMEKFNESLPFDKRMWAEDIRVSGQGKRFRGVTCVTHADPMRRPCQ